MRFLAPLASIAVITALGCGGGEPAADQPDSRSAGEYEHGHHDHGHMVPLGEEEIEGVTVRAEATRLERPGQNLAFDIDFIPASSSPGRAVLWIGGEQEPATEMIELEAMGPGEFHEHLDAPDPWDESFRVHVEFDHPLLGVATVSCPLQVNWAGESGQTEEE